MTTADAILALGRANLAAGAAILAVMALRAPARRAFGAHLACALWLMVPAAAAGALTPAIGSPGWAPVVAMAGDAGRAWLAGAGRVGGLAALWLAGLAANVALALWRQSRFAAAERAGRAGPAVVGVLRPRLVTPADFAQRFTEAEQRLVRAHELAHLALARFRADQELACDATVMRRMPKARRAYAAALLRAEPQARDLVFGCAWLAPAHPLAVRLAALARRAPDQMRHDLGLAGAAALALASFAAAWAVQPPPAVAAEPAGPVVILMELAPPDPQETAWVFRSAPPLPPAR